MKSQCIVSVILIVFFGLSVVTAQKTDTVFPGKNKEVAVGLQGILINEEPALKLVTPKGGSVIIRFGTRDGEEVLAFPVVHMHQLLYAGAPGESGLLYISKNQVSYVPDGKSSDHGFDIISKDLEKIEFSKSSSFGRNIGSNLLLKTNKKDYRFLISVVGNQGIKHEDLLTLIDYLMKAIDDFDAAIQQFKQVTANIKQADGGVFTAIGRQLIQTKDLSQITSKYDRFKDVTTVTLQSIVSKPENPKYEQLGPTVSLLVSYQFNGQVQKGPSESVLFSYQIYGFEGGQTRYRNVFNNMEEFISLLDGQRLVNKMERAEFRDALGGKYEVMSCPLTLEIFTKFVNAKKAEMRIGTQEFELKGYHLQAFRDLLKKNQP